ncbi:TraB family protein [Prunus dulcis]|uniref:TraB family protein n=1 Tax=Prunus dulcis TaxID=3755 RepID=A0A4Y1R7A8_PRUDU|nr:TraB family protein [Prunus dulcis]
MNRHPASSSPCVVLRTPSLNSRPYGKPDLQPLPPPTVSSAPPETARYEPAIPRARPAGRENFVHVENPTIEDLSDSIVGVDVPRDEYDDDVVSTSAAAESSDQRKVLPEELSRSVVVLTCESTAEGGVCDVHLVGTAHVSVESCREVEAVISYLKPEVVFLELCSSRVAALTPQNLKVSTYEEAMKYGGRVILGDRPVQPALCGRCHPLTEEMRITYTIFLPSPDDLNKMLKEMDDVDMLTLVIQEMSKEYPTLMETLVHERDQYMSSTLLRIATEHSSVVAVVGKGHLQGIKKHWKQPVVVKDLMEIPSQQSLFSTAKVLKSFGVAVAGVAIISGIYLASKK